ncbi:MAG TPA: hypothetical protein VLX68_11255 [Chitinivibrionales bacterium]|nr:hypothetical protein [Chitinivibrionales bacterium]
MTAHGINLLSGDPLWYKDAVIYQLHVKSFLDSTGDGTGNFGGLALPARLLREYCASE